MNHEHRHEPDSSKETKSRTKWVFIGFLVIAGYFLVTEHRAHLSGWLSSYGIWLLLLACPLMHLFMHGGHGGHGGHGSQADGTITVAFMDPEAVLQLVDKPEVHALGKEVRALLQRVCASLKA